MSFIGDFFTGDNGPPAPPPGPTSIVLEGGAPELPMAPAFVGPSEEERAILAFQLGQLKKAAAQQDALLLALERQYGKPFVDVFAEHYQRYQDHQFLILDEQAAEIEERTKERGLRDELRNEYAAAVGKTPAEVLTELAAREVRLSGYLDEDIARQREISGTYMDRFRKAAAGEIADPAVARLLAEDRQQLDEDMRAQYGPGWESHTAGNDRLRDYETGVREGVYRMNRAEMDSAAQPAAYGLSPLLAPAYTAAPMTRELMGKRGDLFTAISPVASGAPVLNYLGSPIPGGTDLLSVLQGGRNQENLFNAGLYNTQARNAVDIYGTQYGVGGALLRDNLNNQALASRQRFDAGNDLIGGIIGAGGSIGAAAMMV